MDVVTVGDVMIDVRVDSDGLEEGGDVHGRVLVRPGGSAANAAVWAVEAGATSRVHARIGSDMAGALLRDELIARGVEPALAIDRSAETGTMLVVHEPRERSMVADRGAGGRLSPDDLPERLEAGAVLVSGYTLLFEPTSAAGIAALERAHARFVAVDAASWPMIRSFGVERFLDACAPATLLLANEREAEELTGRRDVDAVDELSRRFPVVCVKQGEEGALMSWEGLVIRNATDAVVEKDSTGAGDAFNGVLLASLAAGRSPGDALASACRAGARVAASYETWPERPRPAEDEEPIGEAAALSVVRPSSEVAAALAAGDGVVALETSVVSQGLPSPRNLECVERMNAAIRSAGAVPAWIGVMRGEVVVGLSADELQAFAEPGSAIKVARRDLPVAIASGGLGATTVSSTIWAAHRAGIRVGATGGIGGVHPRSGDGGGDVSADLVELARTPVLLVCSGPKSIVDPVATADAAGGARRRGGRLRLLAPAVLPGARGARRPRGPGGRARRGRADRPGARRARGRGGGAPVQPDPGEVRDGRGRRRGGGSGVRADRRTRGRPRQGRDPVPALLPVRTHRRREPGGEPRAARVQRPAGRRGRRRG